MTNPNNAIGTNGAYGGRTSVNAFNDLANAFTRGIISGWACSPDSGLTVSLGGDGTTRDVAIAVDNAGNRTTINNISGSPVNVTLSSAPASNSRIDLIVAYVDNPPQGDSSTADNPGACGIIPVTGTASVSPLPPSENTIRTAITSDGASGTTAYYVVLAQITITSGTTNITSNNITQNTVSTLAGNKVVTSASIDFSTLSGNYSLAETDTGYTWIDGKKIYKRTVNFGALPNGTNKTVPLNIGNLDTYIKLEAVAINQSTGAVHMINGAYGSASANPDVNTVYENCFVRKTTTQEIVISTNSDRTDFNVYVTVWYTKTN